MATRAVQFNVLMDQYTQTILSEKQQRTEAAEAERKAEDARYRLLSEVADRLRGESESLRRQMLQLVRL